MPLSKERTARSDMQHRGKAQHARVDTFAAIVISLLVTVQALAQDSPTQVCNARYTRSCGDVQVVGSATQEKTLFVFPSRGKAGNALLLCVVRECVGVTFVRLFCFAIQHFGRCAACVKRNRALLEEPPCSRDFSKKFCTLDVESFAITPSKPFVTSVSKCKAAQKKVCGSIKGQRCLKCIREAVQAGDEDLTGCSKLLVDEFCQTGLPDPLKFQLDGGDAVKTKERKAPPQKESHSAVSMPAADTHTEL